MEQREVLAALGKIGAARRGQISEQWYRVPGREGRTHRRGPYYVWQRSVDGKKVSERVPREEVVRARVEIEQGKEAAQLIGQFWANAEAAAVKKTPGRMLRRASGPNSQMPSP
jgi:hypothetical protein